MSSPSGNISEAIVATDLLAVSFVVQNHTKFRHERY